jgi:hypothetical protein
MTEEKRKSRMISLRVSDEEYSKLKEVYRSHGARSISDFARISMQRVATLEDTLSSAVVSRVETLDARVGAIEERLQELLEHTGVQH